MEGDLTVNGYKFIGQKKDSEIEVLLTKIPFLQRQGVKIVLDFMKLQSPKSIKAYVKTHFSLKPTKNIILNIVLNYLSSDRYKEDLKTFDLYIQSKNFHPPTSYKRMMRYQHYIDGDSIILTDRYFKQRKIRCEEELILQIGLKLLDIDESKITQDSNFISTAFKVL